MTSGERMVWAAVFADRWRHEAEVGMRAGHWSPRDAARSCALTAATAVEAMRAGAAIEGDMDADARKMLDDMLSTGADR